MTFFDTFFQKVKIFKKTHQIDENTKAHTLFNFCDSSLFCDFPKLTHFLSVHDHAKTHGI